MVWPLTRKPSPGEFVIARNHDLAHQLVSWWAFNEGGGSSVRNYVTPGNLTGTFTNMEVDADWVTGIHGHAVNLDATAERITVGSQAELDLNAEFSIVAVIKPDNFTSSSYPAVYMDGVWRLELGLKATTGEIDVWINNSINHVGATALVAGEWAQIAITSDGTTRKLYLNGVEDGSASHTSMTSHGTVYFGGHYAGTSYDGLISDIKVYKRALTADEIEQLYVNPYTAIWTPRRTYFVPAVGGGLSIPIAYHHYRSMMGN